MTSLSYTNIVYIAMYTHAATVRCHHYNINYTTDWMYKLHTDHDPS